MHFAKDTKRQRWILLTLAVIMGVTLVRGLFWVATLPVWTGDEGAHYSYVQSVATGHGVPVTGRSLLTSDALSLVKADPTTPERTAPWPPDPHNLAWGFVGQQYEGYQAPLYFLLMTPVYWLGRSLGGALGSFYAIRLATVLMAVAALPLVAMLGRELFPSRPAVWVLAPAIIGSLQIVNAQNAFVDNDGLTIATGALCVLVLLRARRKLSTGSGISFGAAVAVALLAKGTSVALVPALALAMVAFAVIDRPPRRRAVLWLLAAIGTASILLAPWLAFNLVEYHAFSGARADAALVEPIIGRIPVGLAGAKLLLRNVGRTLFVAQDIVAPRLSVYYSRLWELATVVASAAAVLSTALRRNWGELAKSAWLAASLPLGAVLLILVDLSQSGAGASISARHLDCLLPIFAVLIAFGIVSVLGSRGGSAAILGLLVASAFVEVPADRAWVLSHYATDVIQTSIPVVEQSYADEAVLTEVVRVAATCPVTAVAWSFRSAPPDVTVDGRTTKLIGNDKDWSEYQIPVAMAGNLTFTFSPPTSTSSARDGSSAAASPQGRILPGIAGTPAMRIYCAVAHPNAARFSQLYPPGHPYPMGPGTILAWPEIEAWIDVALALAVMTFIFRRPEPR